MSPGPEERPPVIPGEPQLDRDSGAQEARLQLAARVLFLVLLAGSLGLWAHLRMPRALRLDVDLTAALPGQLREIDVVVSRDGEAVARQRTAWGSGGAPATLHLDLRARPGPFDVETTLVDQARHAQRVRAHVVLREGEVGAVRPAWQEL